MKSADDIYQRIVGIVEQNAARHRKITLEELKCNKTVFISVEDMIYHFYSVLNKQIEREREAILRAVSEMLAQASEQTAGRESDSKHIQGQ